MIVRFTKACFMDGAIRPAGTTYPLPKGKRFNPKIMVADKDEPKEEPAPKVRNSQWDEGPTRKELMAQLDLAGIKYKPTGNKAYFQGLLDEVKPAAASEVPSKEFDIPA